MALDLHRGLRMLATLFVCFLQVLAAMAREVGHFGSGLVRKFSSVQPIVTPAEQCLRPGWHSLRNFIVIDHLDPQARIVIDTILHEEVRTAPAAQHTALKALSAWVYDAGS